MSDLEDDDNLLDEEDEGDDIEQTYLAFEVGTESYALGVAFVSEIIPMTKIAPVPDTPAYLPGVINLRGRVIPVMSLRRRFGMEEEAARPVVVVVHELPARHHPPPQPIGGRERAAFLDQGHRHSR